MSGETVREVAGLVALVIGGALAVVGFIAAGWWSLVILGGSGFAVGGLMMTVHRSPDQGEDEDVTSP